MDKDILLQHFQQVVNVLLLNPSSPAQYWTAAVAGFLMLAWVFTRVGERMDVSNAEGFHGVIAAAVGTAAMLAAMTASAIYVAPALKVEPGLIFLLIIALVSSVVVAVPTIKFWTQAAYLNTLFAWLTSLVAGLLLVFAINYGFAAAPGNANQLHNATEHNRAIKDALNGK